MIPDTQDPRRRARRRAIGVLIAVAFVQGCGSEGDQPAVRWSSQPEPLTVQLPAEPLHEGILRSTPQPALAIGNLARHGDALWLPEVVVDGAQPEIRLLRLGSRTPIGEAKPVARFAGTSPGLAVLENGDLLLVHIETKSDSNQRIVSRRGTESGTSWSEPIEIVAGPTLRCGPPVKFGDTWIGIPVLWRKKADLTEVAVYATRDAGTTWTALDTVDVHRGETPRLAGLGDGRLVMAVATLGSIARTVSSDSGRTWSSFQRLHFAALPLGFGLHAGKAPSEVALAWTDPVPDTTAALPGLHALRFMTSPDAGEHWDEPQELVLWPGRVPASPSIWLDGEHLAAAFADVPCIGSPGRGERVVCLGWERARLEAVPPAEAATPRYGIDPREARRTLRLLAAHTLTRPLGPRRLFVEGYFMRTLLSAYAIHDSLPAETPEWFEVTRALDTATRWANHLVLTQDKDGYWPLGYPAVYVADMAAALRVFPALEPFVDDSSAARYERAGRRFLAGLAKDGMVLPTGAFGLGWWGSIYRNERRAMREPYLIATSLGGVALHAWLYHRSGNAPDREAMLKALDWTLSQIQADGSLPLGPELPRTKAEGRLIAAAYAQEGWMAADALVPNDPDVLPRLRTTLTRHVDWILSMQSPDGRWHESDGEFGRTPAIVDFLIWYDQRCEPSRPGVLEAIRRAAPLYGDFDRHDEIEVYLIGGHHEVQRAIVGRAIAALGSERFVP